MIVIIKYTKIVLKSASILQIYAIMKKINIKFMPSCFSNYQIPIDMLTYKTNVMFEVIAFFMCNKFMRSQLDSAVQFLVRYKKRWMHNQFTKLL